MRVRVSLLALLALAALSASGCSDDPSGPGELQGRLQAPQSALGAAVLEIQGQGIRDFSGAGNTRVFSAAATTPDTYRVILLNETPGELTFRVSVEDVGMKKPVGTVVSVVDGNNAPVPVTGDFRTRFSR